MSRSLRISACFIALLSALSLIACADSRQPSSSASSADASSQIAMPSYLENPTTDTEIRMKDNHEKLLSVLSELGYNDDHVRYVVDALERLEIGRIVEVRLEPEPEGELNTDGESFTLKIKDDDEFIYYAIRLMRISNPDFMTEFSIRKTREGADSDIAASGVYYPNEIP